MNKNYLDFIPCRNVLWSKSPENTAIVEIENKGVLKKITQIIFKKPKTSYIHLDELGSFIWENIDGKRTIFEISKAVKNQFNDNAEPLYHRLIKYFEILKSYNFITWKL